jgi:hypothetical protein
MDYTVEYTKDGVAQSKVYTFDDYKTFDEIKALTDSLNADQITYQGFKE